MQWWQAALGMLAVAIVLAMAIAVDRHGARRKRSVPGRGWDRFEPVQKLAIATVLLGGLAIVVGQCIEARP